MHAGLTEPLRISTPILWQNEHPRCLQQLFDEQTEF